MLLHMLLRNDVERCPHDLSPERVNISSLELCAAMSFIKIIKYIGSSGDHWVLLSNIQTRMPESISTRIPCPLDQISNDFLKSLALPNQSSSSRNSSSLSISFAFGLFLLSPIFKPFELLTALLIIKGGS
jgi:hypothetical protein